MLIKLKHIHTLTWKVTQGSQGQNLRLSRKKSKKVGLQTPKRKTLPWHGEYGYRNGRSYNTVYKLSTFFQLNKLMLKVTCKYLWFAVFL